jgi:1-deoxy-D-xylulose-5-phosphate reductoisomerase
MDLWWRNWPIPTCAHPSPASPTPPLDLAKLAQLTFEAPDLVRFPALSVAIEAMKRGPGATAAMNAANEVAVEVFLEGALRIPQIALVVQQTLNHMDATANGLAEPDSLAAVLALDDEARAVARQRIAALL